MMYLYYYSIGLYYSTASLIDEEHCKQVIGQQDIQALIRNGMMQKQNNDGDRFDVTGYQFITTIPSAIRNLLVSHTYGVGEKYSFHR